MSAVLDTHAAFWYLENSNQLSVIARATIEDAVRGSQGVYVSIISVIEAVYLVERNRLPAAALERLSNPLADPDAGLSVASVDSSVANALARIPRHIVPDMPDRIIAATALHLGLPLITRDRRLQAAGIETIW